MSLEVDMPGCRQTHCYVNQEESASVCKLGGKHMGPELNLPGQRWTYWSMDEEQDVLGGRWALLDGRGHTGMRTRRRMCQYVNEEVDMPGT